MQFVSFKKGRPVVALPDSPPAWRPKSSRRDLGRMQRLCKRFQPSAHLVPVRNRCDRRMNSSHLCVVHLWGWRSFSGLFDRQSGGCGSPRIRSALTGRRRFHVRSQRYHLQSGLKSCPPWHRTVASVLPGDQTRGGGRRWRSGWLWRQTDDAIHPSPAEIKSVHTHDDEHAYADPPEDARDALGRSCPSRGQIRHLDEDQVTDRKHGVDDDSQDDDLRPTGSSADGSVHCGRMARKKSAVFGFKASKTTLSLRALTA